VAAIGVRPQHPGGVRPRLRTIGQPEEREETLGDEREMDDPTIVSDLEALQQLDAPTRARSLEDDDIIAKVHIHAALPGGLAVETCNVSQRLRAGGVGSYGSPGWPT